MLKIAIVGPESTGKSSISVALGARLNCPVVPEVAREYLSGLGRPYSREDVEEMARLQIREEEKTALEKPGILICDTNLLVIEIWMNHAYGICPDWILEINNSHRYDLHLLMKPDIGWEPDPLREHPDQQLYFFDRFRESLIRRGNRWKAIGGLGETRLQNAVAAISEVQTLPLKQVT